MAYEYERINNIGCVTSPISTDQAVEELQEVYRKAKAFDEIVDIEDDFVKYHGFYPCVEEYAEEVEEIISEYTEDK